MWAMPHSSGMAGGWPQHRITGLFRSGRHSSGGNAETGQSGTKQYRP